MLNKQSNGSRFSPLQIHLMIEVSEQPLGVTELAARLCIDKASASRALRSLVASTPGLSSAAVANVKILTSCPSCLQGLKRFEGDLQNGLLEADYIVVEMARLILGPTWLEDYVGRANAGGIERVLV